MPSQSVIELYDSLEEFQALLAAADLHASGSWEIEFVENMQHSFKRYGAHTNLSPAQQQKLERIAKA
ncbi:hypothetical protein [Pseudomonas gingeri]|uniref:hypothetical protein n=1 Tax=Pseudomonas gingeri TaxID=117681 RepID=UPI0015A35D23|nr:hypothetical protein [Pseudomonas gingeri]NVZ61228.1 hypothetical protein [Pseudomonas gingeri]NVZ73780.1 hypothetical protein [Pseudomonas gingeri]NWA03753.1 hypothetical protein [Pseudomonas gingeri]NWA14612.1 hypothetical protein [Pseudomonas gingeri]NWA58740.1 hypothetical protein [Pseudomonas gingeri]